MEEDCAFETVLVELVKRASLFEALADGPLDANGLTDETDASRSTVHRTVHSFVEKDLLRRTEAGFELTGFGRAVAEEVVGFRDRVESARDLATFLNVAEPSGVAVPVGRFPDATVVHPKPHRPHFAVERIVDRIRASESIRICSGVISPFYVDAAYRELLDGTEIEVVFDRRVFDVVASEYVDRAAEAIRMGRLDVLVCDRVPFELFVFDDCVGMAAHDDEEGIARAFVEASSPRAVAWAEDVYESYRERAERVDATQL